MRNNFRNANIGVAVGAVCLALTTIFFHENEAMYELLGIAAFMAGIAVVVVLGVREDRARDAGREDRS